MGSQDDLKQHEKVGQLSGAICPIASSSRPQISSLFFLGSKGELFDVAVFGFIGCVIERWVAS